MKLAVDRSWGTNVHRGATGARAAGVELQMPRLLLDDGTIVACLRRFHGSRLIIGHDRSADLRLLDDFQVAAIHAGIVWSDDVGAHVLHDYGCPRGTYIDGVRVRRPARLVNGARISIGTTNLTYCRRLPIPGYVSTLARRFRPAQSSE